MAQEIADKFIAGGYYKHDGLKLGSRGSLEGVANFFHIKKEWVPYIAWFIVAIGVIVFVGFAYFVYDFLNKKEQKGGKDHKAKRKHYV